MKQQIKSISDMGLFPKKKRGYGYIMCVSLLSIFFLVETSCLKEKGRNDCPPDFRVSLGVVDKNYSNASSVPELPSKNEQLPFGSYVGNLTYYLQEIGTGNIVQTMPQYSVTGNDLLQTLDFSNVQPGRYILSVFGNTSKSVVNNGGVLSYNLHADGIEDLDTYLVTDTIEFTSGSQTPLVEMKRTKGNLYILFENLPDSVVKIEQQVFAISQNIDQNSNYTKEVVVKKSFTENLHPSATLLTFLAPTLDGKSSGIRLALYAQGAATPFMFIPDFVTTVKRNEISAFKVNFKSEGGVEVWIAMDGIWTKIHDIIISTI